MNRREHLNARIFKQSKIGPQPVERSTSRTPFIHVHVHHALLYISFPSPHDYYIKNA